MNTINEPPFFTYAVTAGGGAKRTDAEIRTSVLDHQGVLLTFETPPDTPKEAEQRWRTMEEKGFHVTADGCIFPYKYFWSSHKAGHKISGHRRSFDFFYHRQDYNGPSQNQYGWPCAQQISHLCHRENCVNPQHLVQEAQWCNLRRNYCGLNGDCTCGMQPACLRTFMIWGTFLDQLKSDDATIVSREEDVLEALRGLKEAFNFRVEKKTKYKVEDQKKANRNKRLELGRKHAAQQKQNLARKRGKEEAEDDDDDDDISRVSKPVSSNAQGGAPSKKLKAPAL